MRRLLLALACLAAMPGVCGAAEKMLLFPKSSFYTQSNYGCTCIGHSPEHFIEVSVVKSKSINSAYRLVRFMERVEVQEFRGFINITRIEERFRYQLVPREALVVIEE